jgi:hypothetical protein
LKATQPVIPVLISDPSPLPPHASPNLSQSVVRPDR